MLVSVIIPCYNASSYIERCLKSLENQSCKDFDVYVIDDASSDNSVKVVESYISQSKIGITILSNKENSGPAYSRLQGIKATDASYICFCDADDWYDDDFILNMVNEQRKNNADVVFTSYRLAFDSGRTIDRLSFYPSDVLCDKKLTLVKASDSLCLIMIKRQILLDIPHPNMRNGEDMALVPLIVEHSERIAAVNKCMYNYYCREDSASMVPTIGMINSLVESFNFIKANLSNEYNTEKEYIGIKNLLYGALINLFKFSYDTKKARQILENFEIDYPSWFKNSNITGLSKPKQIFLFFVRWRCWFLARLLSQIQMRLLK